MTEYTTKNPEQQTAIALHTVQPIMGWFWIKRGMQTLAKQPLGLLVNMFLFLILANVLGSVPIVGVILAWIWIPCGTLGLMTAAQLIEKNVFPMPIVLFNAFRSGKQHTITMLKLGVFYAMSMGFALFVSSVFDGGVWAEMQLTGKNFNATALQSHATQNALAIFLVVSLPIGMLFWHAPGLVGPRISPWQAMVFSWIACCRNWRAMLIYALIWLAMLLCLSVLVGMLSVLLKINPTAQIALIGTLFLLLMGVFFCSIGFCIKDCFRLDKSNIKTEGDAKG